ncbi:hypothetical protein AUQ41_14865 [Thalassospira sp. MCCC 1A02898]|nr:hypothetical protein AUQ41_14865 [Thalassospira sp. MCCC 1A02898]
MAHAQSAGFAQLICVKRLYLVPKQALFGENRTSSLTLGVLMLSMDRNQTQFAKIPAIRGWILRFATRLQVH